MKEFFKGLFILILIVAIIYGLMCLATFLAGIIPTKILAFIIIGIGIVLIIALIKKGGF